MGAGDKVVEEVNESVVEDSDEKPLKELEETLEGAYISACAKVNREIAIIKYARLMATPDGRRFAKKYGFPNLVVNITHPLVGDLRIDESYENLATFLRRINLFPQQWYETDKGLLIQRDEITNQKFHRAEKKAELSFGFSLAIKSLFGELELNLDPRIPQLESRHEILDRYPLIGQNRSVNYIADLGYWNSPKVRKIESGDVSYLVPRVNPEYQDILNNAKVK